MTKTTSDTWAVLEVVFKLSGGGAYDPSVSRFPDDYGVTDTGMLMQFVETRGF